MCVRDSQVVQSDLASFTKPHSPPTDALAKLFSLPNAGIFSTLQDVDCWRGHAHVCSTQCILPPRCLTESWLRLTKRRRSRVLDPQSWRRSIVTMSRRQRPSRRSWKLVWQRIHPNHKSRTSMYSGYRVGTVYRSLWWCPTIVLKLLLKSLHLEVAKFWGTSIHTLHTVVGCCKNNPSHC